MKLFRENFVPEQYNEHISSYRMLHENDLFLDIETLGLSPKTAPIYLIGLGLWKKYDADESRLHETENEVSDMSTDKADKNNTASHLEITQIFARDRTFESDILTELTEYLDENKPARVITFNGDRFDIPFIKDRAMKNHIRPSDQEIRSMDLYKICRSMKNVLNLERCNQTSIEHFLGIERADEYNGGQLIEIYKKYELNPDDEMEYALLQHNLEDVRGMSRLIPILAYTPLLSRKQVASPDTEHALKINIENMEISENEIVLSGSTNLMLPSALHVHKPGGHYILDRDQIRGSLLLDNGMMRYYFTNYKDYVYLKAEHRIVPKALADSIPADAKEPAAAENCYQLTDPSKITTQAMSAYITTQLLNN